MYPGGPSCAMSSQMVKPEVTPMFVAIPGKVEHRRPLTGWDGVLQPSLPVHVCQPHITYPSRPANVSLGGPGRLQMCAPLRATCVWPATPAFEAPSPTTGVTPPEIVMATWAPGARVTAPPGAGGVSTPRGCGGHKQRRRKRSQLLLRAIGLC